MSKRSQPVQVQALRQGVLEQRRDLVAREEPLEIRVDGKPMTVTMRTPGNDRELAAGLLYCEGVIDGPDDIQALAKVRDPLDPKDNTIDMLLAGGASTAALASAQRSLYASSACGICGKTTIRSVLRGAPPLSAPRRAPHELLMRLPGLMSEAQQVFQDTGGLHAAALFDFEGRLLVLREDIGRHNAVDKVLGWRLLQDLAPVDDAILLLSGRAGFEIVQKALVARVPVLAAVGAPSSLAVDLALEGGMQLVGFLRDGRLNDYQELL